MADNPRVSGIVEYSVQKLRARPCAPHWLFALEIAAAILYRLRGASVSRQTKLPLALLAGAPTGVAFVLLSLGLLISPPGR